MTEPLRDKLIRCGWVTNFNADTLVQLIERHLAALAQPEPVGPTDEQINQCYAALYGLNTDKLGLMPVRFGRELLARWGRSAIEPIPVSERPWEREGWCDAEGKCWFLRDPVGDYTWSLEDPASTITFGRNYSLPHWALPTPRSEENLND